MVRIQDLASVLMDRYGLGKDDAELFISQMFSVVTEELNASQKSVKIKGLGTFKVTSMNPRESVDVNTGERIVISGRNKISFTPDVVMRDRVNRPFAQFETVVVNEGVDFSEIDKLDGAAMPQQNVADNADAATDADAELPGVDEDGAESAGKHDASSQNEGVSVTSVPDSAPTSGGEEKNDAPQEHVDSQKKENQEVSRQTVLAEESQSAAETVAAEPACAQQIGGRAYNEEKESDVKVSRRKCVMFCFMTTMAVLLFCAVAFGIYYMYNLIQQRNEKIELLEKKVACIQKASASAEKAPAVNTAPQRNAALDSLREADAEQKKADSLAAVASGRDADDGLPKIDYKSDPRLRTGAYIIIGVEKVVEVKKGQTLESISRTYLGNGMECYVEALNSCTEVSVGDKLKIPKLKWRKRGK